MILHYTYITQYTLVNHRASGCGCSILLNTYTSWCKEKPFESNNSEILKSIDSYDSGLLKLFEIFNLKMVQD